MDDLAYLQVLKRVGKVLVVVGLLDIGLMIYCIAKGIPYSSSLNIFAVFAGIFLIRGSLRAAGTVLWFATFGLTAFACLLVAWPLFVPPGLALTELRLYPLWFFGSLILITAVLGFFYWVVRELRTESVLAARKRTGRKTRSLHGPFLGRRFSRHPRIANDLHFEQRTSQTRERARRRPDWHRV